MVSKFKKKVNKAIRLPSNAVVMSMMAVILVCAAPALVGIIDDSVTQEYDILQAPDYMDSVSIYPNNTRMQGEVVSPDDLGVEIIRDDTTITVLSGTSGYSGVLSVYLFDKSIIANTSKIVIKSAEYSSISLQGKDHNVPGIYDSDIQGYVFALSSLDRHYIMSTESDYFAVNIVNTSSSGNTFSAVESFTIDVYGSTIIPYAEIIVGATGVLLMVCALLATPWVSTAGLTVKRRR